MCPDRSPTVRALRACIHRCATAADGRARWPAQLRCAQELAGAKAQPSAIDIACAAVARRVGEAVMALGERSGAA